MFEFNRTQGCYLEHVSVTARLTHPLLEGVRIQQSREPDTSDPHWPNLSSSLMTVRDTIFNGQGAMGTAIRVHCVDPTPGHVIKNDFHRFERLQISACLHAGLVLEGRNAKQLSLRDVVIQGRIGPENATVLDCGVLTVANASPTTMEKTNGDVTPGSLGDPAINDGRPVYNHGAAFSWISGACMATRIANVYIGDRNDTLLLKAIYCEKGSRWLVVPDYDDGAVGAFPIQLESLRYTVNDNGSALVKLGPGALMAADGPAARIYPRSVAQWKVAGLPWPSSQWDFSHVAPAPPWVPTTRVFRGDYAVNGERVYKCAAQGITAASGGPTGEGTDIVDGTALWDHYGQGTGVIRDLISSRDLLIVGTIESGQSRPGFDRERFIQLTHGSSESLQLRSTAYDPADGAVAVLFDFEVTQSAGTQTIVQLGNRTPSPGGGGLLVRLTSTGRLQLNADGATVTGTSVYADTRVHRMMVVWDPTANAGEGLWFAATDAEIIVGTPNPGNVGNSSTKGFGMAFDGYLGGAPAWFYGESAHKIMTSSSRAMLGVQTTNLP